MVEPEIRCSYCGSILSGSNKFCPNCGTPQVSQASEQPAVRFCPNCGSQVPAASSFCARCGTNLQTPWVPQYQPMPQPGPYPQRRGRGALFAVVAVILVASLVLTVIIASGLISTSTGNNKAGDGAFDWTYGSKRYSVDISIPYAEYQDYRNDPTQRYATTIEEAVTMCDIYVTPDEKVVQELAQALENMMGYVFMAFILLFMGIYTSAINFKYGYADFSYVIKSASFMFLIAVPVLTMRVFAEERKQSTDQLLYSLPISVVSVVTGKYLAMVTLLALPMAVTAFYPLILGSFGTVSYATAYSSLFAFFLLGCALIAVGMNGIAVSPAMLILKGIPEGFIIAWGIHILTDTKPDWKRYLLLSAMYILITYLVRFLPITLGINTVLSPFVLIFSYQLVYRADLNKMIRAMIASIIILVCNALSEVFNMRACNHAWFCGVWFFSVMYPAIASA